jgi:hypothetical protein
MAKRWIENQPAWRKLNSFCPINEQRGFGRVGKCRHEKCRGKTVRAGKSEEFIL